MADESNLIRVRLVTPERTMCELTATAVELPSKTGYFEVLYGHAPLVAELGAGDVIVHNGADISDGSPDTSRYNVSWGFVEVLPDRVTILANDALKPEEIDVPAIRSSWLCAWLRCVLLGGVSNGSCGSKECGFESRCDCNRVV